MKLSEYACIPCQGGIPSLSSEKTNEYLSKLNHGWSLNAKGHLEKKYKFNNFLEAMDFANKVTQIAEKQGHHPDLYISWGFCCIEVWTHKINGLTESDFYMAAKIEEIKL